ncbi:zinc ribbon domain-containing protein [Longirhabdus pacifica]|uniref:zinc ribbon domain-containing protein n=1 Tax=Longirhabdus pacifica TaxID=2305227 RepID=UPI001008B52F|nr:zinc ribbon domain-containing protein [Longirhabdus pacifica]
MNVQDAIESKFVCSKCQGTSCQSKELSMTGTGLSKMFDIQYNRFLFVSCTNCGYVEVYNSKILDGKGGELGNVLDVLFG